MSGISFNLISVATPGGPEEDTFSNDCEMEIPLKDSVNPYPCLNPMFKADFKKLIVSGPIGAEPLTANDTWLNPNASLSFEMIKESATAIWPSSPSLLVTLSSFLLITDLATAAATPP
ncbi:hypothetical protein WICPIJ_007204 [Wickerhamomyces pijperi]|uniref:Uncharacterized protein n=1 Tax=Wickerhamomyces pijperi TaxID=599730 RepID=A0A9P8Q304_WICPI|nr:hypothetical protein WICPIJ_007204 [Wickerhamomyces pijperi]